MKLYDEKILGKLLDTYERSLLYSGKNQINRSITFPIQRKTLPEYFDESALQYDTIHQQLEQLETQGYIRLIWKNKKRGHILEKCELAIEHLEDAYRLLHRKPKGTKEKEIFSICDSYRGKAQELDSFLVWVQERMQESMSVRRYVDIDAPDDFRRLCELVFRILTNDAECFLRQFSIRCFQDSKIAEKDITKAVHVIAEFSVEERFANLQEEEILAEYNIYRNPSWLMMKGNVRFSQISENGMAEIDLQLFTGGLGISNEDIERIVWNPTEKIEKIVTIENLTSFHQWKTGNHDSVLCIYLGGYHNHVKREFLKTLFQAYPYAEYFHFGDIDCGGFHIWKDLCLKTKIPFKTLSMDLETYHKYLKWGRKLTEQDRKALENMVKDPFFGYQSELFKSMLEHDVKLEQECIDAMSDIKMISL